ncbi:MAG: ABC transporter permease [Patescibacteria group bacterium]|nr:ABC transporter permease [Patescibacteria group bacterium]
MNIFQNITKYKDLFYQLTLREIKAKYKQSVLGYAWVLLVPLINLVVLSIVFSFLFKVPTGSIPYPIYLFVALVPWTFLSNAIASATSSIAANGSLITKIYLPREIFPFSAIAAKLVDLALTSILLLFFLIIYRVELHQTLFFVPLIFLVQLALIMGISLILSSINAFFRDVENILGVFLTVWMYLTPVIYSPELIPPRLRFLFGLNPMTGIINAYRNTVLYGVMPPAQSFIFSVVISFGLLIIGYVLFKNRAKYFADVI